MACQTALEEVYWRHRIWPQGNPSPKPTLAEVLPKGAIERRVEDTLAMSRVLDESHHAPIETPELQAELDRMAEGSRDPERLAELLAALGNDPTLAAECLARPRLAERQMRLTWTRETSNRAASFDSWWTAARSTAGDVRSFQAPAARYVLPRLTPQTGCLDAWSPTSSVAAPPGTEAGTAVWTGSEMIVWGGGGTCFPGQIVCYPNTGGRYDPATDSWARLPAEQTPRGSHTAVWTGTKMIIWGGVAVGGVINTGSLYDPQANTWSPTSTFAAPSARWGYTAVWTGSRMIVWGGSPTAGNDGSLYDPVTNTWSPTRTLGAPQLGPFHSAVWTGSRMIVWGGDGDPIGGRYDPVTDTWTPVTPAGAPQRRHHHTAVWTGTKMIVWGGSDGGSRFASGALYDPAADTWTATSMVGAPTSRWAHTAVWTGSEMIVWGGEVTNDALDGGRYDPAANAWAPMATDFAPKPGANHVAVWTGSVMIAWGGMTLEEHLAGSVYCGAPRPRWVALGDSFSSGEGAGLFNYFRGTATRGQNVCHRADTAYSRARLDMQETSSSFFACSGATTANVLPADQGGRPRCFQQESAPYRCLSSFTAPDNIPQLDHPEVASANLITLTLGGNDALFASILEWCLEESDCRSYAPPDFGVSLSAYLPTQIQIVKGRVELALEAIRAKAPAADVRILGYPALFPAERSLQTCSALANPLGLLWWLSLSPEEQDWLNGLVPALNAALEQAAQVAHVRFIPVADAFAGHEICGSQGSWFRELNFGALLVDRQEVFHPGAIGHSRGYRRALEADLQAVPIGTAATQAAAPLSTRQLAELRAHVMAAEEQAPTLGALNLQVIASACHDFANPGKTLSLSGDGFAAGATVTIYLNAPTPQVLTTVQADATGSFATTASLPATISPAPLARIEAAGTGANLHPRVLVAHLTIAPSLSDNQDGDTVPDACDNCPLVANDTQTDADADGLGDACDPCPQDAQDECRLDFHTVPPCRIADTRTTDPPALLSSTSRVFQITGKCGIPATAKAISGNLTVLGSSASGHLKAWPADQPAPSTSVINFAAGQTRANNAILPLAKDGAGDMALQAFVADGGSVHLVLDVNGYFK